VHSEVRHKIKGLVLDSNGRKTRLRRSKCQYVIVNFRLVTVWVKKTISSTGNEGLNLRYIYSESKNFGKQMLADFQNSFTVLFFKKYATKPRNLCNNAHHTLDMSLHYLAKPEI